MNTNTPLYRSLLALPFLAGKPKLRLVRAKATIVQLLMLASGFNGRQGSQPMCLTRDSWVEIVTTRMRLAAVLVSAFNRCRSCAARTLFCGQHAGERQLD